MEPEILKLALPQVTVEDVFKVEGADYSKRPPRKSQLELHTRLLAEAFSLVQPLAMCTEVRITGAGEREIYLEGGYQLTSKLLARMAGKAEKLVIFATTLGAAIGERVAEYQNTGNMLKAFVLDTAGSAIIAKCGSEVMDRLEQRYHAQGLETTFPMGPGHSYWEGLSDQRVIFDILRPERIGLQLNASNLIIPVKSVSMVIGVGHNIPDQKGRTHCDFCSLHAKCHMTKMVSSKEPKANLTMMI